MLGVQRTCPSLSLSLSLSPLLFVDGLARLALALALALALDSASLPAEIRPPVPGVGTESLAGGQGPPLKAPHGDAPGATHGQAGPGAPVGDREGGRRRQLPGVAADAAEAPGQ